MSLSVTVEPSVCIGSGNCIELAPRAFEMNEDGVAVVVDAAAAGADDLLAAEASCPVAAILVAGP